ncbi:hypothetical protein SAMN02745134_02616 [Clostridium acidisoli DSM 12555]|uniref:Uncharacterized protein n=1 Tax=Clostridium acidisoli DSM 12555 TaxID=1121291 RepID=A0A1W1XPZ9_9CLOT|nr:hypothetical protein [Clostridium acidisoli]SMC25922.1 hypothetical protein SAMN02745134_02616 [Clostridium acidisoli DSM 12555]
MKAKKLCVKLVIILIIVAFCVPLLNRIIYGTFNVYGNPNRLYINGVRYTTNGHILTLKDKPMIEISGTLDKLTGKRVYSTVPNYYKIGNLIYLHLYGDKYLGYSWGGGP